MPTASPIQTNLTSGELSERMRARVDLEQYGNGADIIENAQILPQGGGTKRTGSYFVATTKNADKLAVLRPFKVSNDAAYVMEIGDGYTRFYRNRGQLLSSGVPLELVTPWAVADLRALRFAESVDVLFVFHVGYRTQKISRTAASTFQIAEAVFEDGPYDSENTGDLGASETPPVGSGSETGSGGGSVGGSGDGPGPPPDGPGGADGHEGAGDQGGQGV